MSFQQSNRIKQRISDVILEIDRMDNQDLTFWKNYQVAMQWIKGNPTPTESIPEPPLTNMEEGENDELEFAIDDDLLDFYRLSRDHKTNRSTNHSLHDELIPCICRKSEDTREERSTTNRTDSW